MAPFTDYSASVLRLMTWFLQGEKRDNLGTALEGNLFMEPIVGFVTRLQFTPENSVCCNFCAIRVQTVSPGQGATFAGGPLPIVPMVIMDKQG